MATSWNKYESRRLSVVFRETVGTVELTIEVAADEVKNGPRVPAMKLAPLREWTKAEASWFTRVMPEAWAQWEREFASGASRAVAG